MIEQLSLHSLFGLLQSSIILLHWLLLKSVVICSLAIVLTGHAGESGPAEKALQSTIWTTSGIKIKCIQWVVEFHVL